VVVAELKSQFVIQRPLVVWICALERIE